MLKGININMFNEIAVHVSKIDIWIIFLFFTATLFVSYRYGRKIKTVADYALADRKLPLPIIAITLMATLCRSTNLLWYCTVYI